MAGLKLQAVSKSWDGKTQVIQPLTLDVADGEFIVMVGPSGCGKSTLLRMVAGLERVTSGDIWIDRKRVTEMEPKDRGIAMVFQNYALYPNMTVYGNMAYALKIRKMPKDEIDKKVHEVAKILEIEQLLDRKPAALSGGQKQRISIARVFLKNPPILILDEATSALDNESERWIQHSLEELSKNRTTITIAHRLSTIKNADEIIVITENGIAERGTHETLLEKNGIYAGYYNMT